MIAQHEWVRHSLVSFACGNKVALFAWQFIFLFFFNLTKWRQRLRVDR